MLPGGREGEIHCGTKSRSFTFWNQEVKIQNNKKKKVTRHDSLVDSWILEKQKSSYQSATVENIQMSLKTEATFSELPRQTLVMFLKGQPTGTST